MSRHLLNIILLILMVNHSFEFAIVIEEKAFGYLCRRISTMSVIGEPKRVDINVVYLVHNDQDIPRENFQIFDGIVQDLQSFLTNRYNKIRLGLCLFNEVTQCSLPFGEHKLSNITSYTTQSDSISNHTRIDTGLLAVEKELSLYRTDTGHVPTICVMLTASPPDNITVATTAAASLKAMGVNVLVVTVGGGVTKESVEGIASNKDAVFAVVRNISAGEVQVHSEVSSKIIRALSQAQLLPKYTWCYEAYVGVLIIVDIWENLHETLIQLKNFVVEFDTHHVSLWLMILNSASDNERFPDVVNEMELTSKSVTFEILDLQSGIRRGRQLLLEEAPKYGEKIIIVATDRGTNNIDDVIVESRASQEAGIHIMALGVGSDVTEDQLRQIITDPIGMTKIATQKELTFGLRQLYRSICHSVCHKGWVYYDGMCFTYKTDNEPWLAAQKTCSKHRAKLVSITTARKYVWLKEQFFNKHNRSTHIGLRKHAVTMAPVGREFRWENGKPLVFTDWSQRKTPPEPDGAGYEECVAWYPDGWRDVVCTLILDAGSICEKEADNVTEPVVKGVDVLPLMEETVCPVPESGFDPLDGPVMATGDRCRPVLSVYWQQREVKNIFSCVSGEMISIYLLCDGIHNCQDGSDETNCSSECNEYQFPCTNGRCVSLAYVCDFWDDCGDNSDESNCAIPPCKPSMWQCNSGQCIPEDARCDLYYDCYDGSDENACEADTCDDDDQHCDDGTCIPPHWFKDGQVDCNGGRYEDEKRKMSPGAACYKGTYRQLFYLFVEQDYINDLPNCTMVYDGFGKQFESFSYSSQVCNGDNIICPIGFYRCPLSYCIPIERVCDGVMDCVDGEDEYDCEKYDCPGYYRCPGTTYCHHPARLCDGEVNCPGGKDELMCDFKCPDNCVCSAGVVECRNNEINGSRPFDISTRKVIIENSHISYLGAIFKECYYLREALLVSVDLLTLESSFDDQINLKILNVSYNNLIGIPPNALSKQQNLRILDVSNNPFYNISTESFSGLKNLQELYMAFTSIDILKPEVFSPLVNLEVLDLRGSSLHTILDNAFDSLAQLRILFIQDNTISNFGPSVFRGLDRLEELYTDMYSLCCSQVRPRSLLDAKCVSPKSSISSCSDLLASDILRSSIWVLCIASLLGNTVSTLMRIVWERNSMRNGFGVFVTHLGIADFFMGVYLLIIAIADTKSKGSYIWQDFNWRHSYSCKIAGALSTLSSEASTLFICLITLDRFLIIKFPFGQFKFRYKSATVCAALAWTSAFIIAAIPLIPSLSHWNFYTKNGACLALPFTTERTPGWMYSVLIFTGLNFFAFLIIALGQLSIYRVMKRASFVSSKERRAQEMAVARRLLLIVATDFLCWFPVGIMSVLALSGITIGGEVFAWTGVFILPVNSALNPFLYTIPAIMQRIRNKKFDANRSFMVTEMESKTKEITDIPRQPPYVRIGDPDPGQVLLETVLAQLKTEDRISVMKDVCTGVMECLRSLPDDQPPPNAVYLSMQGKDVVVSMCLTHMADNSNVDLIENILSLVRGKPEKQKMT